MIRRREFNYGTRKWHQERGKHLLRIQDEMMMMIPSPFISLCITGPPVESETGFGRR